MCQTLCQAPGVLGQPQELRLPSAAEALSILPRFVLSMATGFESVPLAGFISGIDDGWPEISQSHSNNARPTGTHALALFPAPNHKSRSSHQTFSKWFSSRFLVVLTPYVKDKESGHERRNTRWSSHRLRGQAGDTEACVLTTIRSRQNGQELIHSHNHNLPHRAAPTAKAGPVPPSPPPPLIS